MCLLMLSTAGPVDAQDYCEDPVDDRYEELMDAARQAIEAEDFEVALANFELAYRSHQPGVLEYSIGRAHHHLGQHEQAIDFYNRFLRQFPECPDPHGLMEAATGYRNLAVRERATSIQAPLPVSPADSGIHPAIWVLSAGGALILGGVIYDLANMGIDDDIQAAYNDIQQAEADGDDSARTAAEGRLSSLQDDRDGAATVDWILYGSGAAAVVAGVVMLIVIDDESGSERAVQTGARPVDGGWMYTFGGRF